MWQQFLYCEIFHKRFSDLECRAIIDFHNSLPATQSVLYRGANEVIRDSGIYWLYSNPETSWVFDRINAAVEEYNKNYQYEINRIESAQLTRYAVGQRYDWHVDIGHGDMSRRKISLSTELTEPSEYQGGGLIVGNDQIYLGRGDMALFSSFMMHRAPQVESGERWSLVCWILGDRPLR